MKLIDILSCTDSEDEFLIFYDNVMIFCGETKSDILAVADRETLTATVKKIFPAGCIKPNSKFEDYVLHIELSTEN